VKKKTGISKRKGCLKSSVYLLFLSRWKRESKGYYSGLSFDRINRMNRILGIHHFVKR
jgi:hypothetical protein